MTVENFKMEKVLEKKQEHIEFNFKKNVFLLNKQEILKDYVSFAILIHHKERESNVRSKEDEKAQDYMQALVSDIPPQVDLQRFVPDV